MVNHLVNYRAPSELFVIKAGNGLFIDCLMGFSQHIQVDSFEILIIYCLP